MSEHIDQSLQDEETSKVFEVNSWQTLAQYLGAVALSVPGALAKILREL